MNCNDAIHSNELQNMKLEVLKNLKKIGKY